MENKCQKFIDFIITQKCTYRCPYCSQSKCQNNNQMHASKQVIEAFYDFLDKIDKDYEITITGGEAILHPDFFEIITRIKEKGFDINLISNLSFKLDTYKKIFDLLATSLNRFDISIHINQIQNFNLAIEKLEEFSKTKPKTTQTTIFIPLYNIKPTDENKINKIIKLANKYNIKYSFQKIRFLNKYKKTNEKLFKSEHKLRKTYAKLCYAGCKSAVIYEDGSMYRCYSSRFSKTNYLGNITKYNCKLNSTCKVCTSLVCSCPKPYNYGQITQDYNKKEAFKNSFKNILFLPNLCIKQRKIILSKIVQFFKY